MISAEDFRLCTSCLAVKPIGEFRRRSRHGEDRMRRCRQCHNDEECLRRMRRRLRADDERIAKFVTRLKNAERPSEVEFLCHAMVAKFGGLPQFAAAWVAQAERVREQHPASKKACDFFPALVRLMQASEAQRAEAKRKEKEEIGRMSQDELENTLRVEVEKLVRQKPSLAIAAAKDLGFTIVPPTSFAP